MKQNLIPRAILLLVLYCTFQSAFSQTVQSPISGNPWTINYIWSYECECSVIAESSCFSWYSSTGYNGENNGVYCYFIDFNVPSTISSQVIDKAVITMKELHSGYTPCIKLVASKTVNNNLSNNLFSNIIPIAEINQYVTTTFSQSPAFSPTGANCSTFSNSKVIEVDIKNLLKEQLDNGTPKTNQLRIVVFPCSGLVFNSSYDCVSNTTLTLTTHPPVWQYNGNTTYYTGKVGIGTNSPSQQLHVKGNAYFENGNVGIGVLQATQKLEVNGNTLIQGDLTTNNMTSNGNGVINNKLYVLGRITSNEIIVSPTLTVPDFVFDKDYKLMSINDLEKFVSIHKHLPQIAPEKEMTQNGVEMSSFQLQLLQKIEEMTLYVIEHNKQIDTLKKEIEILKLKQK